MIWHIFILAAPIAATIASLVTFVRAAREEEDAAGSRQLKPEDLIEKQIPATYSVSSVEEDEETVDKDRKFKTLLGQLPTDKPQYLGRLAANGQTA